jgi:hypothetical protein
VTRRSLLTDPKRGSSDYRKVSGLLLHKRSTCCTECCNLLHWVRHLSHWVRHLLHAELKLRLNSLSACPVLIFGPAHGVGVGPTARRATQHRADGDFVSPKYRTETSVSARTERDLLSRNETLSHLQVSSSLDIRVTLLQHINPFSNLFH